MAFTIFKLTGRYKNLEAVLWEFYNILLLGALGIEKYFLCYRGKNRTIVYSLESGGVECSLNFPVYFSSLPPSLNHYHLLKPAGDGMIYMWNNSVFWDHGCPVLGFLWCFLRRCMFTKWNQNHLLSKVTYFLRNDSAGSVDFRRESLYLRGKESKSEISQEACCLRSCCLHRRCSIGTTLQWLIGQQPCMRENHCHRQLYLVICPMLFYKKAAQKYNSVLE